LNYSKRGFAKRTGKSLRTHIEPLENRQLLSATLSVTTTQLVFNAVQKSSASPTETLTLTDTGTSALTLGSGAFTLANDPKSPTQDSARFSLLNKTAAPATLSPGQSFTLQLNYSATAIGINSAFLDIATNDSVNPLQAIALRGIGTKGLGGTNQPSLATILQAYNIPTYVGEGYDDANAASDSTYPNPPDASSQEVVLQRLVKAGAGPVTINVLASFTASGFSKSYVLGTYTPGNTNSLNQLFYTTATENQTTYVQPQGATTFDPGSSEFGFYFISNEQVAGRVGYSEDALNTWDTTNPRKFRFFPMETPTGTIVPNTYIMTSTEWNSPAGYDFTNIVAIVSNVKAAPSAPTAPVIGLTNTNAVAGSSTMVFNRIGTQNPKVGDQVHDTGTLQVTNTGGSPLIISSYSLTSQWTLVSPPSFPLTIQPGKSQTLSIKFIATSVPSVSYNQTNDHYYPKGGGVYDGSLTLHSNDPNNGTATVALAGYYQTESENSQEPSLQTVVNLLEGWSTTINSSPIPDLIETNASTGSPTYYGQEVVSPYWMEADPGASVTVQQIASFHTEGNNATTSWYTKGSSSSTKLFETASDDGQTLLPYAINTTTPAAASFSSSGIFGFECDNIYTDDAKNPNSPGAGHHFRFFPVYNASGDLVPNTYIMAMDYTATPENFDFQDNIWLISNIRPATTVAGVTTPETTAAPATPTDFFAAGTTSGVSLQWAPVQDSALVGYDVYRSTSLTGTYALLNSAPITTTSYIDPATTSGSTYYYKVTALDSTFAAQSLAAISEATALTTSVTAPAAPANLTATGIVGGITLAWSAVNDPTLAGYNVYSSSSASGTFVLLNSSPITATTYTDNAPAPGVTTYYQVTSIDAASGLSSSPSSVSGAALAVSGLQSVDVGATPSGSTTVVTPGTGFDVTAGGPGIAANADGFRYIYQTQTGNFDVKVQVTSITVAGNYSTAGILARSTLTTTSPDVYMSASPVNYRFKERSTVGGLNNIVVGPNTSFPNAWVRLSRVGNLFTGYYSTDGVNWTMLSSITLALPATLDLGLGVASNVTTMTTTAQLRNYGNTVSATPPAAPTNLTATGITNAVKLSWTASTDTTLKGYNVYSSSSAGGTYKLLTSSPISATSYTDSTAVSGVTTYYHVTAVDSVTGLESAAASAAGTATASSATPPAAPTNLSASGVAGAVYLTWNAVSDSTLKGYNVYSSNSATGTYTLLTLSPIATTAYTDASAKPGTTTYYRVTAVDASTGLESIAATADASALFTNNLTSVDIGASPAGSTTFNATTGSYNVVAGGPGVTGTSDGFRFLYTTETGNFDVKVQVASITVAGNYSTAGIMARSSLDADSADVYMSASPVNYRFKNRDTTGATTNIDGTGSNSYPNVWVRLQRVGNVFNGYYSTNGVTWTLFSSATVALPATVDLGLAVGSNVTTETTTAVLNDYSDT
jgi:fibronectin type 3 domain-containing protein/regulation of enolase protein 1 (concanavalin A-like superfamily)